MNEDQEDRVAEVWDDYQVDIENRKMELILNLAQELDVDEDEIRAYWDEL